MARKKQVLIQCDRELLAQLDAFAAEWTGGNRSRAIAQACEQMLARHAQFLRERRAAPPRPTAGGLHSADSTAEAASRPLTADLRIGG